jgi:DNA polymerase III epsilon subunit-like protein
MSCSTHRGSRAFLSGIRALYGLDQSQAQSVFHMARAKSHPAKTPPTQEKWTALVTRQIHALALDDNVDLRTLERLTRYLRSVAHDPAPDARTFAALSDLDYRAERAQAAIRRQINSTAALRGATPDQVRERFQAFRAQYLTDFRGLPASERPDPPARWVTGYRTRDMKAVSSPQDRATLYAMYRCQADPDAFPINPHQRFASIDLETAGPAGRDGFIPENGSIIEVGITEYDVHGTEVDRYSHLIRPADDVLASCGTGAVDVHGITVTDVADAPPWSEIAPHIADRLAGRVMMAQHAPFEQGWLGHHLPASGQPFDVSGPTVDTLTIARQHFSDLPDHRLATICGAVGVDYTNGHRALHDAEVAGRAFFAMRRRIFTEWQAAPARARAPQPAAGAGITPPRGKITRTGGASLDPTTITDEWLVPRGAPVGASA